MTITLCNSHPFTFYLPFHTSLRADQCPIQSHVPSTCTLGLDPCARHSLFGRTDPYYIDNFYSSCGLKRLAATLASPFSVIVLSSQYLFQRGPIWMTLVSQESWHDLRWVSDAFLRPNSSGVFGPFSRREWTGKRANFRVFRLVICPFPLLSLCFLLLFFVVFYCLYIPLSFTFIPRFLCCNIGIYCCDVCSIFHCFCCHGVFVSFIASL